MTSAAAEAAFEQATYDAIITFTFTSINECPPSRRSVDTLRKQVEHAMVKILCPHWDWAGRFGLLAEIKPAAEYATITGGLAMCQSQQTCQTSSAHGSDEETARAARGEKQPNGAPTGLHGTRDAEVSAQSATTSATPYR